MALLKEAIDMLFTEGKDTGENNFLEGFLKVILGEMSEVEGKTFLVAYMDGCCGGSWK